MSTSGLPKIYEEKENVKERPEIPNINKITANDMNSIRELLLNALYINGDRISNIDDQLLDLMIPRYEGLSENVNFEISKNGDWTIKKYDNGYVELYQKITTHCTLNNSYGTAHWTEIKDMIFPLELTELTSIHTDVLCAGHILVTTYSQLSNSKYSIFIADLSQSLTNQQMTFYTTVIGRWK